MPENDPYAGSPYDASGMPLGAETVDYDVPEDVAAKTVFDKPVVDHLTILDVGYEPQSIDEKLLVEVSPLGFNQALDQDYIAAQAAAAAAAEEAAFLEEAPVE